MYIFKEKTWNNFLPIAVMLVFCFSLHVNPVIADNNEERKISEHSYSSTSWNIMVNQPKDKEVVYPEHKRITPETMRLTLDEYYVPQVSGLLTKGVDYFEWLNKLDDPYLNRYKVDLEVDPEDERLKLFWKRNF